MPTHPHDRDRRLAGRCLAGEQGAWEELHSLYAPVAEAALRRAHARCGLAHSPQEIEDLLQETFASLAAGDRALLRRYDATYPLARYIQVIAQSRAIERFRKRGTDFLALPEGERERLWRDLASEAESPPASEPAEARELQLKLAEGLERLPPHERTALRMVYWESAPAPAVARFLGIKNESVWALLSRARKHLAEFLKGPLLL